MDIPSLISALSALAAIASAIYAKLQVKQAKESSELAQKTLMEAFAQNKINALIALKNNYEELLPKIKKMADHFSVPETYEIQGKPLYEEHEEYRKKLQQVNAEIDKFHELYVAEKVSKELVIPKNSTYAFANIFNRFGSSLVWCLIIGVLIGFAYRMGSSTLQQELKEILGEQSAPKSFHLISVLVTVSLGIIVAIFGRQAEPSYVRVFFCYRPAEIALSLCAVFVGLLAGFGIGVNHWPITFNAFVAFTFSGALLLGILWLSFPARVIANELYARLVALALVASSLFTLWWTYQ